VAETTEKFSVIKTMQAVTEANVALFLLDARQGVSEQDAHVASFILEAGRAVVVGVNKWDNLSAGERAEFKRELARTLNFLDFARIHFVSALEHTGLRALMKSVDAAYRAAMARLPTPRLTRALQAAVMRQAPPRAGAVRPKLRYAHQGGTNPPLIVIHGNALNRLSDSYRRYLERFFRDAFKLVGTPLRIELRSGRNPYAK
jgi:GTP-binding protein